MIHRSTSSLTPWIANRSSRPTESRRIESLIATRVYSESKRTVSLQALPPEVIAAGGGYPAKLTFESGPFAGRIVALPNQMVTVGRAPENDVVVSDPATSGRHGRIEVRGGAFPSVEHTFSSEKPNAMPAPVKLYSVAGRE